MWVISILVLLCFPNYVLALDCKSANRGRIQWYFDPSHWTCFAYPVDCNTNFNVEFKLYNTEEECTLKNMVRLWKTYTLSCGPYQRMAVYERSNGDHIPYIFSSSLCHSDSSSDICNNNETCMSFNGFAYCCGNTAFQGNGPTRGIFNFTGVGGKSKYILQKASTEAPVPAPRDCNTDGDRKEIEWYPNGKMMCLSRRKVCSTPQFGREIVNVTYNTQQECMDAHFPNWKMSYRLTCSPGYSAAKQDAALIFSKDKCGSMHHSDVCNRDEYCAYKSSSPFAFCCKRSSDSYVISYVVYGKNYRRRIRRQAATVEI